MVFSFLVSVSSGVVFGLVMDFFRVSFSML